MKVLYNIWFRIYTRERGGEGNDSSGFLHVFLVGKVSGVHNWIYFYQEQQKGTLQYEEYINYNGGEGEYAI